MSIINHTLGTPAVTYFSPDQLAQIVKTTIPADLPAGHKNALVGAVDAQGTKVVLQFKMGKDDNWEVNSAWEHAWTGQNQVGAELIYSWGD